MEADIHKLYESDFNRILDFKCRCRDCSVSKPEYSNSFCISFVRKGNFLFNVFRQSLDSYNGCVLITKPGYERTVTHTHTIPDECTIFDFKKDFSDQLALRYQQTHFFKNHDLHSTLIKANPGLEYLHFYIVQHIAKKTADRLQIDTLVMDIIDKTLHEVSDYEPDCRINSRLKKNHLTTIELAKEFLANNFTNDISLMEIARRSHSSPFHFSRIFKIFTGLSPHQFLLSLRLQHAITLLQNTSLPVADIAYSSGFNSVEHFSAAFKIKFSVSPVAYRTTKNILEPEISKIP